MDMCFKNMRNKKTRAVPGHGKHAKGFCIKYFQGGHKLFSPMFTQLKEPEVPKSADDSNSDGDLIVITYQYLQLNFRKSTRPTKLHKDIVMINTGSTCSVFNCEKMFIHVKKSNKMLGTFTNGGHQISSLVGNLPVFFLVWFNPKSMINILAGSDARKRFRITVDTVKENAISVHIREGKVIKFAEVESGLYLLQNQSNDTKKQLIITRS